VDWNNSVWRIMA